MQRNVWHGDRGFVIGAWIESSVGDLGQRVGHLLPRRSDWSSTREGRFGDLAAGATVALVALPLALAFGVSSGLGAEAGLVTAIVAGAVAAVFGGSNLQVSGPTGAMTVVIVPVTAKFGPHGVLMVGLMAGVVLVVLALSRVGRYARYLPLPVVEGFTAGIAVVIALQQVPSALGQSSSTSKKARADKAGQPVATFALDADIRFATAADRAAFANEFSTALTELVARYHAPAATSGRTHRVVFALHPTVTRTAPPEEEVT